MPGPDHPIQEMSAIEFRRAVGVLFLGDLAAVSRYFAHAPGSKAVRRWADGSAPVSKTVTIILRAAIRCDLALDALRAAAMEPLPRKGEGDDRPAARDHPAHRGPLGAV